MKKSILLGLGAVAMAMGVGAGLAVNGFKAPVEAAADDPVAGETIYLNLGVWADSHSASIAYCAQFWDVTSQKGSGLVQMQYDSTKDLYYISVPTIQENETVYPANRVLFTRNAASSIVDGRGNWDSGVYNQTDDLTLGGSIFSIASWGDYEGAHSTGTWNTFIAGLAGHWRPAVEYNMPYNGSTGECSILGVYLPEGTQIQIVSNGAYHDFWFVKNEGARAAGLITSANKENGNFYSTKSSWFDIYYKTSNGEIYIAENTVIAAEHYGEFFNESVGCNALGTTAPSGWATVSEKYADLSDGTKQAIVETDANQSGTAIEKAMATYDWAVSHNTKITDKFIVGRSSNGAAKVSAMKAVRNESVAPMIGLVCFGLAAAATLVLFARKRKDI